MLNPRATLEKISILWRREYKLRISYRTTLAISAMSTIIGLFSYALLGNTAVVSVTNQSYGISLASFLVSGVAFSTVITNGLGMFYPYASPAQLEEVMVTPIDFKIFILLSSLFNLLVNIGAALVMFGAAVFLFGLGYSYNFPILIIVIVLGIASSIGLGFLGLGFQLVYKQSYVLSWFFYSFSGIVGNMLIPIQVLPGFLQILSYWTPQYYFFTGIRLALGAGRDSPTTIIPLFALYTLVLLAIGSVAFRRGLDYVRRNGTQRWV